MANTLSDTVLLAPSDYAAPGRELADALGAGYAPLGEHRFPDGESLITLPSAIREHVFVYSSLDRPNERLLPLLLTLHGLRDAGARWIGLICPYLAYMRQDAAFNPGEVISQQIISRLLAAPIDALWTVDPHLHRVRSLNTVFPDISAVAMTAAPLLADWIAAEAGEAVLLGPDLESEQWVSSIAARCQRPWGVATKTRLGDREVEIQLPDVPVDGKPCVLIDDVASTGRTLAAATQQLLAAGATQVDVLVTHAMLVGDAEETLRQAGVGQLISTDSITHTSNRLPLAPLLGEQVANDVADLFPG